MIFHYNIELFCEEHCFGGAAFVKLTLLLGKGPHWLRPQIVKVLSPSLFAL